MNPSIQAANNRIANQATAQSAFKPSKKWGVALLAILSHSPEIVLASRSVNTSATSFVTTANARNKPIQLHQDTLNLAKASNTTLNNTSDLFLNITSFLDGPQFSEMAPPEMISAAREYLSQNPLPKAAEDLSAFEGQLFAFMKNELVKSTDLIPVHLAWHDENGSGGGQGPGSGVRFMDFHHGMMNDVKRFLGDSNQTIPIWTHFNANITQIIPAPAGVKRQVDREDISRSSFEKPSFLTLEGGVEVAELDGKNFTSLEDFSNPDELGRVIGIEFHSVGHSTIGGTMDSFEGPRDPIFDAWHGALDQILMEWINTNSGQAYLATDQGKQWHAKLDSLTGLRFKPNRPSDAPSSTPSAAPSETQPDNDSSSATRSKAAQVAATAAIFGAGLNLF